MNTVLAALQEVAARRPRAPAFADERTALSYAATAAEVQALGKWMRERELHRVALLADNSVAWALWDLAALQAGITLVPLPLFFSDAQIRHALSDAGIELLISDDRSRAERVIANYDEPSRKTVAGRPFRLWRLKPDRPLELSPRIARITYTSGTTGTPKGVRLTAQSMVQVAASLVAATQAGEQDRHLALLPLSTLLENIGAVYAPILAGGSATLYGQAKVGMQGASGVDPARMLRALESAAATTAITLPQLLKGLVAACRSAGSAPQRLRYLAVGGAPVSAQLVGAARENGLPVYEGYGLSECASVVAVNTPGAERMGSVGRVLPHARVRIADDGEIEVGGALFDGYLHDPRSPGEYWPTGDLGHLDGNGFLHITGRKRNVFITAFGRNVAPEWVEAELTAQPGIAQAAVFGEARPFNVAVVVPRPGAGESPTSALAAANHRLPDYAQVRELVIADQPFTPANGLCSANGVMRRDAIEQRFDTAINARYEQEQVAS
jgi:long-subunit acyl-CoA synthetase (AMP-forming)